MKKFLTALKYTGKTIKFLWPRGKLYLILNVLAIFVGMAIPFPPIYLVRYTIELLTSEATFNEYVWVLLIILSVMAALSLFQSLVGSVTEYVRTKLYIKINLEIRDICYCTEWENLQSKSFIEKKDFAVRILNENHLVNFINSFQQIASGIIVISGLSYIITEVSLLLFIPLLLSVAMTSVHNYRNVRFRYVEDKGWVEWERKDGYLKWLSRSFTYAKEIRLFGLRNRFQYRLDELIKFKAELQKKNLSKRIPSYVVSTAAEFIFEFFIYLYLGYRVIILNTVTLGLFAMYAAALRQIKTTLNNLFREFAVYTYSAVYLNDFFSFLNQKSNFPGGVSVSIPETAEIRFENVSYRYPGSDKFALRNINVTIKPNETMLIVGENGSGKSTFAKLLCGLLNPTNGRILFNGIDISTIKRSEYMQNISAVFQDYRLFNAPIWENITAMNARDNENVNHSLEQVNLYDKVKDFPNGNSTHYGRLFDDDGVELSGGETQRLAIARAIFKKAPVLILDEPTSAIDPRSEYEIFSSFKKIHKSRTTIFISHRMSSSSFADRIMVFVNGEVAECGTHDELIARKSTYNELYSMQADLYQEASLENND